MQRRMQIYKGHMIEPSGRGFNAHFDHLTKWFPSEIAAKHWINIKIESHEKANN